MFSFSGGCGTGSRCVLAFLAFVLAVAAPATAQETSFKFTSTPNSWVGHGFATYSISPAQNWNFTVSGSPSTGFIRLSANNLSPNPTSGNSDWSLELKAPAGQLLAPGMYANATRYPFQAAGVPGFWLSGNGRGDNEVTGFFNVLQAESSNNVWTNFAVDFRQNDEGNISNYVDGHWRFSATVPEPMSLSLMGIAACALCARRPRRSTNPTATTAGV